MMKDSCIGLLVPPADDWLPAECSLLYPELRFLSLGLGIREMSESGFSGTLNVILDKAKRLAEGGAEAISIMGASLTFHRGKNFNMELIAAVAAATGVPTTSMSHGMVNAILATGADRVAAITAYDAPLNMALVDFLAEHNIAVTNVSGLGLTAIDSVRSTSSESIESLADKVYQKDTSAAALLISCGGLPTLSLHRPLEQKLRIPVVSSFPAGLWDVVRLAGNDPRVENMGRMFQSPPKSLA